VALPWRRQGFIRELICAKRPAIGGFSRWSQEEFVQWEGQKYAHIRRTVDTGRRLYVIDGLGEDQRRARRHMVLEVNIT